jgi:hypothetical protein
MQFFDQRKVTVLDHPPYSPDLAPADYFLFPKVKSHLKGRLLDSILDIQKAVTNTLNTIAKDDFYRGIQKLYDRANQCVQLEGMYSGPRKSNGLILKQPETRTKNSRKIRFETRIKIRKSNHERSIAQHRLAHAI